VLSRTIGITEGGAALAGDERPKKGKIGLREIRALPPNTQIFDSGPGAVPAFGARRRAGSAVSYFVMFRTDEGRQRLYTIGQHGAPWTPDSAREKALAVLSDVKLKGGDPSAAKRARREAATVADLCEAYWADAESGRLLTRRREPKKASTLLSDRGRIEKHIRPLLGAMKVATVTREDVRAFMHAVTEGKTAARHPTGKRRGMSNVRGGKGVASRTVGLLGAIFSYAVENRMRSDNPVRGVIRPADGRRERRLSDVEYAALGAALRQAAAGAVWPAAVTAIRFLAASGWRAGEALGLRWADVDLARRTATLADTKTGRSMRPLSHTACDALRALGRGADAALVFPPTRGEGTMTGFRKLWDRIAGLGDLPADVTPHVLRHSFASLAADLGYSEPTIGALIGHKGHSVTSRYMHAADAVLLAAADAVAAETMVRMGEVQTATIVPLRVGG
jgi:integrase